MSRDGGISRRDAVNCTESRAVRFVLLVFDCLIFGGANDRGNRELRDMLSRCASLCRNSHFVATICMSACVWVAFFAPVGCGLLFFFLILPPPPASTLFPYTTLFRSARRRRRPNEPGDPGSGRLSADRSRPRIT